MGSSLGSQDPLSGPVLHSPALHQQLPRAHRSSSSLLLAVLSQIQHRAAGGHGAGARIRASPHSQTQEGVKISEFSTQQNHQLQDQSSCVTLEHITSHKGQFLEIEIFASAE